MINKVVFCDKYIVLLLIIFIPAYIRFFDISAMLRMKPKRTLHQPHRKVPETFP